MSTRNDWWVRSRARRMFFALGLALAILLSSFARHLFAPRYATVRLPDATMVRSELADDDEEHRVGLSEHASLDAEHGMLFLFDAPGRYPFWMKDMRFPIDIVWISGETVVGVANGVPNPDPGTPDDDLTQYFPPDPVDRVLELRAGVADAHGLKTGDRLDIVLP